MADIKVLILAHGNGNERTDPDGHLRLRAAMQYYADHYAVNDQVTFYITCGVMLQSGIYIADLMQDELINMGVPEHVIVVHTEGGAANTLAEVVDFMALVSETDELGFCSSYYHLPRIMLYVHRIRHASEKIGAPSFTPLKGLLLEELKYWASYFKLYGPKRVK